MSVVAALTLLPALLGLLGDRVNGLRLPTLGRTADREASPSWSPAAGGVMRRPGLALVIGTAILLGSPSPCLT